MSILKYHAEWLSLIEISGPFLSLPILKKVFPQGLDAHDADHFRMLRQVHEEWDANQHGYNPDPVIHTQWVKWVLRNTLELEDVLIEGQEIPQTLKAEIEEPQHRETLRPDMVVMGPDEKPRLLVQVYPLSQKLGRTVEGKKWKASPDTRMTQLLRDSGVPLGLVTNGDQWMLVYAPKGETSGYASWYSTLWLEEKKTLAAFRTLLGLHRFFGVPIEETLAFMLAESASQQQEVTDQLGSQVRNAVEILIQSLDRADQDYGRKLLARVPEKVLYEAALTVMMRLVFLFCAEERELLLLGDPLYDEHYAVSTLVAQLQNTADQHGEEILERRLDAWCRLLSTFRAVYGGVAHDRMHLPAYSGNLFDPDRFPFLEGRKSGTSWLETEATPLPINNRTVLHLLRSLQYLELHGEAQRLSFRALDIEQIGHVYEGLLDHTAKRSTEPVLGLVGKHEPETPLSVLEEQRLKGDDEFYGFLKKETGSTRKWENYLDQDLKKEVANKFRSACGNDEKLFERVKPLAKLVRIDTFGRPVVIPKGSVYVTAGTDRRSSGTHYTPKSLTEPIVKYTLEPLVYEGPALGVPRNEWELKTPKELLDLKICDMACGSGAFLVQACRYMSERLLESWEMVEGDLPGKIRITPFGETSKGDQADQLIPESEEERQIYARRIVSQRCLYGVDVNPLACEMAKLSLWLLTLAKDKPFTFLDHSVRCGDSLVGISRIEQLQRFSLNGVGPQVTFAQEQIKRRIDAATLQRKSIEQLPTNNVEDIERKMAMLRRADEQTDRLRYAANMMLAVFLQPMSDSARMQQLKETLLDVQFKFKDLPVEELNSEASKRLGEAKSPRTFNWPLEFPEVFSSGGFDSFVGNPPFRHGSRISSDYSAEYLNFLKSEFPSSKGNTDLVCYFLLRTLEITTKSSYCGFISTNSISEGDNQTSCLDVVGQTRSINWAISDLSWPGDANLYVSLLGLAPIDFGGQCNLNGVDVTYISSSLSDESPDETFVPLVIPSQKKLGYKGVEFLGDGFKLGDKLGLELFGKHGASGVVKRWLNGDHLTDRGELPSHFAIDFADMSQEEASKFPECFDIVEELVKPKRADDNRAARRNRWWQYGEKAVGMRAAISPLKKALVRPFTSDTYFFDFVDTSFLFTNAIVVIPVDTYDYFAILNSSVHEVWARKQGSSMKMDFRYTPSKCIKTFPFPDRFSSLKEIGREYESLRQRAKKELQCGMTDLYAKVNDEGNDKPIIAEIRRLHRKLDSAVCDAYGWGGLQLNHGFFETTKNRIRYTIDKQAQRDVLKALQGLNQERYEADVEKEARAKKEAKKSASRKGPEQTDSKKAVVTLFELEIAEVKFPSSNSDHFLCAIFCDLLSQKSGLSKTKYFEALVFVRSSKHYMKLLLDEDSAKLTELIKKSSKQIQSIEGVSTSKLVDHLVDEGAIDLKGDQTIETGKKFAEVRKSFPDCDPELIRLILKLAEQVWGAQESTEATTVASKKVRAQIAKDMAVLQKETL